MPDAIFGFNRPNVVTVAALAGAAIVGYCIYYGYRRSSPNYYQKIMRDEQADTFKDTGDSVLIVGAGDIRDPSDAASVQAYFLQEVQLGEQMMAQGKLEQGAIHIANAVALCGQAPQLLEMYQQAISSEQFEMVLEKLPHAGERLVNIFGSVAKTTANGTVPVDAEIITKRMIEEVKI